MRSHPASEGSAVLIILTGDERLDLVDVRLFHTGKLADLKNPVALQFFRSGLVIHIRERKAVRIPLAAELGDEGGFPDALIAIEHEDMIEFHARILNPGHGGTQSFTRDRTGVRVILRTEVIDQDGFSTGGSVPRRKTVEKRTDRMVGPIIRNLGHSDLIVPCGKSTVVGVDIADELCIVRIPPEPSRVLPGHIAFDLHAVRQLIEAYVFQVRIVLHDQRDIVQAILQQSAAVPL